MGLVETARTQANDFPSLEAPATFETPFPADVWERLGKSGLLGVSVPHAFSGGGNPASSLFQAGEALVDGGCTRRGAFVARSQSDGALCAGRSWR